jgi:plastocyanin
MRRFFVLLFILLIAAPVTYAQTTIKTVVVSAEFANIPGTPRIIRNGLKHLWLAVWRQGTPGKILGRIIDSQGGLKPAKVLASGVSSSPFAFDIFYDSIHYTHLLAYENAAGLQVQFINQNFVKQGRAILMEGGVSNTNPRLAFDAVGQHYILFWLSSKDGVGRKVLKSRVLDSQGHPVATARTVATASGASLYSSLSVSTNQKNGNLMVIVEEKNGASGRLLGFSGKPDGSLLRPKPVQFQGPTPNLVTVGDAAFTDAGTGFGFWSDRTSIKFRKISATGALAGPTKLITGAADANSIQPSILFDAVGNQFLGVWGQSNKIRAVAINPSGTIAKQAFQVATTASVTSSSNVATSYDGQIGNAIAVWDDQTVNGASHKFRIRAALFAVEGAASQSGVTVGDNFYQPANLTVRVGATVVWTVNGNNQHTVTSDTNRFGSGTLNHGQSFSFRFTTAGTYTYHCLIHGTVMSGTILVQASGEPPPRY